MKSHKLNIVLIGLSVTAFCLFIYSFKFLLFLVVPVLYNYMTFLKEEGLKSVPVGMNAQIVHEYPTILNILNICTLLVIIFSLSIIFFIFLRAKNKFYDLFIIFSVLIVVWALDVLKFNSFKFYNVIPNNFFNERDFKLYFFFNWIIFLSLSFFIFFKWIRRFFFPIYL